MQITGVKRQPRHGGAPAEGLYIHTNGASQRMLHHLLTVTIPVMPAFYGGNASTPDSDRMPSKKTTVVDGTLHRWRLYVRHRLLGMDAQDSCEL